jgi:hypothetical protein
MHENLADHAFAISSYQSAVTRNVTMRKGIERTKLASVHVRKNVWTNVLGRGDGECVDLATVAMKLLSMHATACVLLLSKLPGAAPCSIHGSAGSWYDSSPCPEGTHSTTCRLQLINYDS